VRAERTGRVWDEVRRTLGRMGGRVTTHAVPEARSGIAAAMRHPATEIEAVIPDTGQTEWQPNARVFTPPPLTAPAGASGSDLAAVTTIIGVDGALNARDVVMPAIPCVTTEPTVHSARLAPDAAFGPATYVTPIQFGENSVNDPAVSFGPPPVRALPGVWTLPAKPTMGHDAKSRWQFAATRVRDGKSAMFRTPMTRERVPAPYGMNPALAFTTERAMLAAGAGVSEADVSLIGVFPKVPLEAVQRLSVAPGGTALNIWFKPEVAGRSRPIATVTVVLGRQRSTGKTLQAVRRGDDAGRGT
jgi:hypothetical protein